MKGIIFNLLEEVVSDAYGEETWDALLDAAELEGAYTSLGTYSDRELTVLVAAASSAWAEPPEAIVRWLGRASLPLLAKRYPQFFEPHTSAGSFVLTLNDIIHPEVRKLYPGAIVPEFGFHPGSNGDLTMTYDSPRKLCALAEGFIEGAAAVYGEKASVEQPKCMIRGDDHCVLQISLSR